MAKGGYVLKDCAGQPELIFIATGSEVELAVDAAAQLTAKGRQVTLNLHLHLILLQIYFLMVVEMSCMQLQIRV